MFESAARALNATTRTAFGEPVTIRRSGLADVSVRGVFDRRYIEQVAEVEGAGIVVPTTSLTIRDGDLPAAYRRTGTLALLRDKTYRVTDARPDGQGMTILDLETVP